MSMFGASGAVTVTLTPADSQHILSLVKALPKGSRPDCRAAPGPAYRLTVAHAAGLMRGTVITGYLCAGAVSVAVPGSSPSWYTDAGCRLAGAIRRLVPARAEGTRRGTIGCR